MKIAPPSIHRQADAPRERRRAPSVGRLAAVPLAALALAMAACGPVVAEAPFRARPDTIDPGDLLGPYDGQVLDVETDKPVAGALVYGAWSFARGLGFVSPYGAVERTVETGADGRYHIPRLEELPGGLSTRVARFTLVVYRHDYAAYRSDRTFPDLAPRRDFVQRDNVVRLTPWSPEMSHVRHLAFLGGGARVRQAATWELAAAATELDQRDAPARPQAPASQPLLNAAPLLTADEIRAVTGYQGQFIEKRLADLERTSFYDSRHFQAVGHEQRYDVALRFWKLAPDAAAARYQRLLAELPGAASHNEVGDRSLRAQEGEISAVAFLDRAHGAVVEITCGQSQCPTPGMLVELARRVLPRLAHSAAAPATQPAAPSPAPKAKPPATPPESPEDFQLKPPGLLQP